MKPLVASDAFEEDSNGSSSAYADEDFEVGFEERRLFHYFGILFFVPWTLIYVTILWPKGIFIGRGRTELDTYGNKHRIISKL